MNITDEYYNFFTQYQTEYGERCCVLMQIGSFYEIQSVRNDKECWGNLFDVASLLNIQITKKNKSIETVDRGNPYMCGFPKVAVGKFLPLLLDNGWTVVLIDQDNIKSGKGGVKRAVSAVYSPGIQPIDIIANANCGLTSVYVTVSNTYVSWSVAFVDTCTNEFHVYEDTVTINKKIKNVDLESIFDNLYRVTSRYDPKEYIVRVDTHKNKECDKTNVTSILDKSWFVNFLGASSLHFTTNTNDNYTNIDFQNTYLKKVYANVDFGLLQPIEYFQLEMCITSVTNILYTIDFIAKHDTKYIQNLGHPKCIERYNYLTLELNTLEQLNIVKTNGRGTSTLFDVINFTKTQVGKRHLKSILTKPLQNADDIIFRLQLSRELQGTVTPDDNKTVRSLLQEINDFERLHRKMSLGMLHPSEFYSLHKTYLNVNQISTILRGYKELESYVLSKHSQEQLETYIKMYSDLFIIDEMRQYNTTDSPITINNFFASGKIKALDTLQTKINGIETEVENIRVSLERDVNSSPSDGKNWIKTMYTETDGYFFTCTKLRSQQLQKRKDVKFKTTTSMCKITTDSLEKLSLQLVNTRDILGRQVITEYRENIVKFWTNLQELFEKLVSFIRLIDVSQSNISCAEKYNYHCPTILQSENGSSFTAKGIRHPIIERVLQDTSYVPNEVSLGTKTGESPNAPDGMILYALNACGKSSLLKSVGLCVVMAQCGLYVPCDEFTISPFHRVISQVDMNDNLWKSHSSFVTEMIGLRKILRVADEYTLVLSDELTKGTEVVSATAIFAASALHLVNRNCKFIFTTHLQEVSKLQQIASNNRIRVCHLSVTISGDEIVFERKLQDGPCPELYGLEVAKAIGIENSVMEMSFEIRDELVKRKREIVRTNKSRYNSKKILDCCEICGYAPTEKTSIPLDTHHIKFQCNADESGYIKNTHVHAKSNLVCLCKECHVNVHKGLITINGYVSTTNGVKLDWCKMRI